MIQYRDPFKKQFTRELIHLLSIIGTIPKKFFFSSFYEKESEAGVIEEVIDTMCYQGYIREGFVLVL